jgi:hypothetical protein
MTLAQSLRLAQGQSLSTMAQQSMKSSATGSSLVSV